MKDTKLRISEALLELLQDDYLIDIQMQEIADKAEITTRSIRRYFKGKESILIFYVKYLLSTIDFTKVDSVLSAIQKYLEFWVKEKELVELLRTREILYIITQGNMEFSRTALTRIFREHYDMSDSHENIDYLIDLIVHMEVSMFHTWITKDYHKPFEEVMKKIEETFNIYMKIEINGKKVLLPKT